MTILLISLLIIGYLVGLSLRPKWGVVLTITGLLGIFAYIFFFAHGDEGSPSFAAGVGLYMAFFASPILLAYGIGAFIGTMTRWLTKKGGKIYAVLITIALLIGSSIYVVYDKAQNIEKETAMKREELLFINFVKNHKEVKAIAVEKFEVFPSSCTVKDNLPIRCEMYVRGAKNFYAIVDVSRLSGIPTFTLACISYLSRGQRDSSMDACKQLRLHDN